MKFTDRKIKNLRPKAERYELWEGNGFGIRVTPKGTKSWVFLYRFDGRPRRMTLGVYPQVTVAKAHEAHGKALADLERDIDPGSKAVESRAEARTAPTVRNLAEEYLEKWAKPRKRSWREDERILNCDVLPRWGRRKARDIKRRDVIVLLDRIIERGAPIASNRTLAVVRKMFNFAVSRDIVDVSPCLGVKAPAPEQQRDRVLDEHEIRAFWNGLDIARMQAGTRLALRLQLLTAQRNGEVVGAEWSEIDLTGGWWTIPAAKSKNKLAHRVPLSPQATRVLKAAREICTSERYIFPSPRGDRPMTATAISHAVRSNLTVFDVLPFTPHDLRRTAASRMTSIGVPRLVVSKILNHAEVGITAVYDRNSYDDEKRRALTKWGSRVAEIVAGEPAANVVSLR